jgi:hypothetical protein
MYFIDVSNAVSTIPTPNPPSTNPGYFAHGNPALGVAPTVLDPDWLNCVQSELINAAALSGLAPSKTQYNQLAIAIASRGCRASVFVSSGVWTVPQGCYSAKITCVGAGAGAGYNSGFASGGGGSGGATIKWLNNTLTPGTSYTITVGAGGAAAGTPGNGQFGGSSSFGTICTALGGAPGGGGSGPTNGGGIGGYAAGGDINFQGGMGGDAIEMTTSPGGIGGYGGGSIFGGSPRGATGYSFPVPFSPYAYGAGGSASGDDASGDGASGNPGCGGIVIIEY